MVEFWILDFGFWILGLGVCLGLRDVGFYFFWNGEACVV